MKRSSPQTMDREPRVGASRSVGICSRQAASVQPRNAVPTIVPVTRQDSASTANATPLPPCCQDLGRFDRIPEDASGRLSRDKRMMRKHLLPEVSRYHHVTKLPLESSIPVARSSKSLHNNNLPMSTVTLPSCCHGSPGCHSRESTVQQPNRIFGRRRTQVHIALRRREIRVSG